MATGVTGVQRLPLAREPRRLDKETRKGSIRLMVDKEPCPALTDLELSNVPVSYPLLTRMENREFRQLVLGRHRPHALRFHILIPETRRGFSSRGHYPCHCRRT